jgi:hypothetical protein
MRKTFAIATLLLLLMPVLHAAQEWVFKEGRHEEWPEFVFARLIYSGPNRSFNFRRGDWATDYPAADRKFMWGVQRLTNIRIQIEENAVAIMDPDLFRYPFVYVVEPGRGMYLTEPEARRLREYVDRGGFMIFDDFWGTVQWRNFANQIAKIFPDREIQEIPTDHEIFHTFYDIDEFLQVPNVNNGIRGGPTWQQDGYTPHLRGVFDEKGRLCVAISFNSDIGDAWEWMDHPQYPEKYSGYAYRIGLNFTIYAMTH